MIKGGNIMGKNKKETDIYEEYDEEKAKKIYEKSRAKAEELLEDEDKMERFLQKLEKKLKTIPLAGSALAYVPLMISLVRSFVKREYRDIPVLSIISIVITLIYVLSPADLIPDFIPAAGLIDDASLVATCLLVMRTDLEDYRQWRKKNGYEFEDLPDYDDIAKDSEKVNILAKIFFKGKNLKS